MQQLKVNLYVHNNHFTLPLVKVKKLSARFTMQAVVNSKRKETVVFSAMSGNIFSFFL